MAAAGFVPADYETDDVEVWPENWPAWQLFIEVSGQWRMSMNGPVALDYVPLFARMDRMRLADAEWQHLFEDVRVIEAAALAEIRKT